MKNILIFLTAATPSFLMADSVTVRENLANPEFPTHIVSISAENGLAGPQTIIIRCENNKTEVFVTVDGVFGYSGIVRVRWPNMPRATRWAANDSTTGTAAFLANSIEFTDQLVRNNSVVVEVEGYNVRGAGRFSLTGQTRDGIYELAETCQWINRLPQRTEVNENQPSASLNSDSAGSASISITEQSVRFRLRALLPAIDQFGRDAIIRMLDEEIAAQ
jgi:hypothetical protein